MNDKVDLFSQMSHYHEQVQLVKREFIHLISIVAAGETERATEQFSHFFRNNFVNHFKFEEMVVFPALRTWSGNQKYTPLLEEYLSLHEKLLVMGSEIKLLLLSRPAELTKEYASELVVRLGTCSVMLLQHAQSENTNIVPLLKQNSTLRFLSGKNLPAFKMALKLESLQK